MKLMLQLLIIGLLVLSACAPKYTAPVAYSGDQQSSVVSPPAFGGVSFDFSVGGCGRELTPAEINAIPPETPRIGVRKYDVIFEHRLLDNCCNHRTLEHERIGNELVIIEKITRAASCDTDESCQCLVEFQGIIEMLIPGNYTVLVYKSDMDGTVLLHTKNITVDEPMPEGFA